MKKLRTTLLSLLALSGILLTLVSCGGRTPTDISGATSVADLAGTYISAQSGTYHEIARTQIPNVKGQVYADFDSLLAALKSGAIDGYIAEEPTAFVNCRKDPTLGYLKFTNNQNGFTATPSDTAIAVGCKKGSSLTARINAVLTSLSDAQKSALMEEIFTVNAGGTVTAYSVFAPAPEHPTGTLKIAMECAYDPFNGTQTTDASGAVPIAGANGAGLYANGYDVQIAKYIAHTLGMELEVYSVAWDSLIGGVESGTYDAVIAGMSPTEERREKLDFTAPYYSSNLVVIYRR